MEQPRQLDSDKIYYQADLFLPDTEISALREQQHGLRSSLDKLRKGLFRRFDELSKSLMQIILRQDERDLEIAKLAARIEKLESRYN